MSIEEAERIERDVEWRIDRCFPPFVFPDEERKRRSEPDVPHQIEEMMEDKRKWFEDNDPDFDDSVSVNEAIVCLFRTDLELEPETREYLSWWAERRPKFIFPDRPDPNRDYREFAECTRRVKQLLMKSGPMKAEQAEQAIADDLGIDRGALIKRLQNRTLRKRSRTDAER
jgi:hypothetical protein